MKAGPHPKQEKKYKQGERVTFVLYNIPLPEMIFPQLQSPGRLLMCLSVSQKEVQSTVMFLILWFPCQVSNAMMDFIAKTQQRSWLPWPRKHGTKLLNHQGKLAVCISLSRHVAVPFLETLSPESSILAACVFWLRASESWESSQLLMGCSRRSWSTNKLLDIIHPLMFSF